MHLHPRCNPSDFRPSRASLAVMRHLAIIGPLTVGDASRHLNRSQAATSELVNRLIARGFLSRQIDDRDRRQHLIWLTTSGRELVTDESRPLDRRAVQDVLEELEQDERQKIIEGLRTLAAAVNKHAQTKRRQKNE